MHKFISILIFVFLLFSCGNPDESEKISGSNPASSGGKTNRPSESVAGKKSGKEAAPKEDAAQAFYREIMAEYGQNCYECVDDLEIELRKSSPVTESDKDSKRNSSEQLNVVIALDSSGSMAEDSQGEPRLTAAKIAISEFVDSLPATAQVSLVAFGHQGSNAAADKATSCAGIETVYPLAKQDSARFKSAVNSFSAKGYTPLADTLEFVNADLSALPGERNKNIIYLVSDGVETCDGDPVSVAKELNGSQTKLLINVIGFDVDNTAQAQLQAIAKAGGGQYYSAKGRTELQEVWKKNTKDLAGYRLGNLNQRNSIFLTLTNARNSLFLCMTNKVKGVFNGSGMP